MYVFYFFEGYVDFRCNGEVMEVVERWWKYWFIFGVVYFKVGEIFVFDVVFVIE